MTTDYRTRWYEYAVGVWWPTRPAVDIFTDSITTDFDQAKARAQEMEESLAMRMGHIVVTRVAPDGDWQPIGEDGAS